MTRRLAGVCPSLVPVLNFEHLVHLSRKPATRSRSVIPVGKIEYIETLLGTNEAMFDTALAKPRLLVTQPCI